MASQNQPQRNKLYRFRNEQHGIPLPIPRIFNVGGSIPFFNPTSAYFRTNDTDTFERLDDSTHSTASADQQGSDRGHIAYHWTSRNNRKGIHDLVISPERADPSNPTYRSKLSLHKKVLKNIGRMFTEFPIWDISYLIAMCFLLGSGIWVVDGIITFLPVHQPSASLPGQSTVGGGITAFVGTCVFVIANILLWLETVNEPRNQCYGWSPEYSIDDAEGFSVKISPGACQSHHGNKHNLLGPGPKEDTYGNGHGNGNSRGAANGNGNGTANENHDGANENTPLLNHESGHKSTGDHGSNSFRWLPTWNEFRHHYLRETSFIAILIQLTAVTLFLLGAFPRLPPIYNMMDRTTEEALFWIPKVIGGVGFTLSNYLYLLETQDAFCVPRPQIVGWHIGGWSIVGSIGFTLSAAFGLHTAEWCTYQSSLAVIWGSGAFFVASVLMWYESLDKYTMHVEDLGEEAE